MRHSKIDSSQSFASTMTRLSRLQIAGCICMTMVCLIGQRAIGQSVWDDYSTAVDVRVNQWLSDPANQSSVFCGLYMVDLRTGESFVDTRGGDQFMTASNMKLLTAGFALAELGPSFSFSTWVYLVGNDIVVIGDGDPTIGCADLSAAAGESPYAELDRWADAIKTIAGPQFTGDLKLCSLFYNLESYHYPSKGNPTNPAWYTAPVDALNFHDNTYDVTFVVSGGTVTPTIEPAGSFIELLSFISVGSTNWSLYSTSNESRVTLTGSVASTITTPKSISANHPAMLLGRTLADRMVQAGIPFTGQVSMIYAGSLDLTGATLLYTRQTPLADSLKRMNKRSLNMAANCHFLRAGNGTWAGTPALMTASLASNYGLDTSKFGIFDGSGLSGGNAAPALLVDLLEQMTTHPDGNIYIDSLPISGVDGTLAEQGRYTEPQYYRRVLGKTGTGGSASCISGYVLDAPDGEPVVVFSILTNRNWFNDPGRTWWGRSRDMQDDLVKMLVDAFDGQDATPPTITAWRSVATHGRGVGEVALEIADDGTFSEPRAGGATKLEVDFSEPIAPASFAADSIRIAGLDANGNPVSMGAITISTSLEAGDRVGVIEFDIALPDHCRYLIRIDGVTDVAGNLLSGDADRNFVALRGDVSGDRRVNVSDHSLVRSARTKHIDSADVLQVRADVSEDGRVNVSDLSIIRPQHGLDATGIPAPVIGP